MGRLIEEKHEHLLATVQRSFVVRRFCLHLLQEMRLSKLKALAQTDFRAVLKEDPDHIQPSASSALKVGEGHLFSLSTFSCKIQNVIDEVYGTFPLIDNRTAFPAWQRSTWAQRVSW